MVDKRLNKLAKVLVNYSLRLKKGDFFLIDSHTVSEPLVKEVFKEALLVGANPIITPLNAHPYEECNEILLKYGSDEQISFVNPASRLLVDKIDAFLTIWGDLNTKSLNNIDPAKMKLRSKARKEVQETYMRRMGDGSLRWCGTQYPTYAAAMDADMSLSEYEEFVFSAGYINTDDPESEWKRIHEHQQKYVDFLNGKSKIEVKAKDTHLTIDVSGREWINCDGRVNFPDGEVFTSPVENSINGHIRFSYPAIYMEREVEDVTLEFKDGVVVSAKAKKGEDFLNEILHTDEGASRVGEFAIGTNYNITKFTKNMLFDEKIGGTIHMAVGASIMEAGGKNVSAIHWDMLCDMKDGGEIYADGELFYKDGKFLI